MSVNKKLIWPETIQPTYYNCHVCNCLVGAEANQAENIIWYSPASRYWNVAKKQVYCSAEHSLESEKL